MEFEYYNNYLKIANYRQLKLLESDKIIVDNLEIIGLDFFIMNMNKEEILIKGLISNIKIGWDI